MALSLTCKNCDEVLTGADEDELVAVVQAHIGAHARDHGATHEISREQVLARLEREGGHPT